MKIVAIIGSMEGGGAERVMSSLTEQFAARGHDVVLLTALPPATDFYEVDERVHRAVLPGWRPPRSVLEKAALLPRRALGIRRAVGDADPDVVLVFTGFFSCVVLASLLGTPHRVFVSERVDPRMHHAGRWIEKARPMLYRRAAGLIVQTENVVTWASEILSPDRVHVLPNPLAIDPPALDSSGHAEVHDPFRITAVGRMVHQKGFDLLLDAVAHIPADIRWTLEILGEGPLRPELERQIDRLGLRDRVAMPGSRVDLASAYEHADAFVLPSRYEGFPNALVEAMAHGVAVITADCPSGPSEIVDDGVNGLLVSSESPRDITAAIERLVADDALRRRLGQAAREVRTRFAAVSVADRWLTVLGTR